VVKLPDWLTWLIILLVTGMAVTNFVAGLFVKGYQPNVEINGLFIGIVTALILNRRNGNGNGNGNGH